MNRIVDKGRTLLVDGPASVTVNSGKVEVFGLTVNVTGKVVIREGKRLPFEVLETASLEISAGESASVEEVNGSTIPESWVKSVQELLDVQTKPARQNLIQRSQKFLFAGWNSISDLDRD